MRGATAAAIGRAGGGLAAGAIAGVAAACSVVRVNGSIVGAHDAAVVVAWLALAYGVVTVAMLLASGALRFVALRGASIAAPPNAGRPFVRGLAEGALQLALTGAFHAVALRLVASPLRALVAGGALAVVVVALCGRGFAARFGRGRLLVATAGGAALALVAWTLAAARVEAVASVGPIAPVAAPRRVVLVGLDGADWRLFDRLIAQGRLPTVARLARAGVRSTLGTLLPTWSPRLWNTISTGCLPERHGVLDFTETPLPGLARGIQRLRKEPLLPRHGGVRELVDLLFRGGWLHEVPVTACHRRVPALWNVAGDRGLRVASLNWYASWPAEAVNGYLVSDNNPTRATYLERKFGAGTVGATAITYPESLQEELARIEVHDPGEANDAIAAQPFFDDLSDEERAKWVATRDKFFRAFRTVQLTDSFVFAAADHLLENDRLDLVTLFVSGIDNLSHRSHRRVEVVERWCDYVDRLLAQLVAKVADERTAIVVVSDHGWEYEEGPRLGHEHGPEGLFLAWGAGIRSGVKLGERADERPSLVDIAPTVQALLGLPTARTQDGRPFAAALTPELLATLAPPIESFGPYVAPIRPAATGAAMAQLQSDAIEKLKELGYVK